LGTASSSTSAVVVELAVFQYAFTRTKRRKLSSYSAVEVALVMFSAYSAHRDRADRPS